MLDITKVYPTKNYGPLKILSYNRCDNVEVQFVETGYKTVSQVNHILKGNVRDYLAPAVFGVGFIGDGIHKAHTNGKATKPYQTWIGMLGRCYCPKYQAKTPTYKGCSVAKEWHNYQVFAEWFELNYVEGCEIDKDIKVKGNKIYGPEFCQFVTPEANSIEAHAKNYVFISPTGVVTKIYNMTEFCRDKELKNKSMSAVHNGKRNHHKGWRRQGLT